MENANITNYNQYVSKIGQLRGLFKSQNLPKIIWLLGSEDFFIYHTRKRILQLCQELQLEVAKNLESKDWQELQGLLTQSSLFGGNCVYFFHLEDGKVKDFLEKIISLKQSKDTALVVIGMCDDNFIEPESGYVVPCKKPTVEDYQKILQHLCLKHTVNLSQSAGEYLIRELNSDLFQIENEIVNLSLYHGLNPKNLEKEDLEEFINTTKEEHVFQILDLVLENKLALALSQCSRILEQRDAAFGLIGLIAKFCRDFLKLQSNASSPSVGYYFTKRYNKFVGKIPKNAILILIQMCLNYDQILKSSSPIGANDAICEILSFLHKSLYET